MKVTNQKPAFLVPAYTAKIKGDFDPVEYLKQTIAAPLFTPVVTGQPVTISANGGPIDQDTIAGNITACCGDIMDTTLETWAKTLFGQTLTYFDPTTHLAIQELFAIQAAVKESLPFPSPAVMYTPATDVIPISKEFLAGKCDYEKYFATLAFYARPHTLGFYFANETAFDACKTWLGAVLNNIAPSLPSQTNQLMSDFLKDIKLSGLTESLILRNDDSENNEEFSFARTLVSNLMAYTTQVSSAEFGVLPFTLGELFVPKTVVFVNVERHAHATAKQVADEWTIINDAINMKVNMVSLNKLSKLTAAARSLKKIQAAAVSALSGKNTPVRSMNIRFKRKAPNVVDITRIIKKIMSKMATVNMSENSFKSVKMTFAKPNRREPDNFNKQGKSVSTKYKPDIHLYIDTSGSISEENYEDAIKACIKMARALNVNLFFNSFSHVLSQCARLSLKDKSAKQAYTEFQRIPKVSGGTDYEQIWHYINKSKRRRREISVIVTDFEWAPPNRVITHPKNLYYIPCSHMDWTYMTSSANNFCQSMMHIDPGIRQHLLF